MESKEIKAFSKELNVDKGPKNGWVMGGIWVIKEKFLSRP